MSQTEWARFRVRPVGWPTLLKRTLIHTELLVATLRRARGSVLEIGTGSGAQAALLSRLTRVVTVENDERIRGIARTNLARFGPAAQLLAADGFRLPFRDGTFGVGLSQGLLEHFEDAQIGALVREQLRVCRSVVFSVPSDHYPRQDVGDERLMPPAAWQQILEAAVDRERFRVRARYGWFDPERVKYSILARRALGAFSVLVTIDRISSM